jgi:uncharacterized protein (TIGR02118 family)
MYKLIILIEEADTPSLDESWPQFLHLAEQMPSLRREATSRVAHILFGKPNYTLIHELYFDSLADLQDAMASPFGQQAGQLLQRITGGRLSLLVGDHTEDDLENIRKHQQPQAQPPQAQAPQEADAA